jgi:hypothetical protein
VKIARNVRKVMRECFKPVEVEVFNELNPRQKKMFKYLAMMMIDDDDDDDDDAPMWNITNASNILL